MVIVETEVIIRAPIGECFDLARDIGLHTRTVWKHTRERAVAGVTQGRIGAGETVTLRATHFGIRQNLTARVTDFEPPLFFAEEMVSGVFKSLRHEHRFEERGGVTVMTDRLVFSAPLGLLGRIAEVAVLRVYMKRFLEYRGRQLKQAAESGREDAAH